MNNYIKTSITKLKKDIENNKLVVFVGAGVSANSNCPSWDSLINKFADELGINSNDREKSIGYYLKIPQYYYIERGEKEYFDVIEETINSIDPVPNDINKIIFKLNPHAVITTNFDDLIEKTIKSEGLFYTTVRQDKELPYATNEKMVIKMHGDGKLKNIVLKEEDYLNYSRKFPLIENYIRGLFSTKTILFIGYSAEDPDFKILFQWVKDQLKGHFQPAYLLEVGNSLDRINFNYYKDRGINILYYDEISECIESAIEYNGKSLNHYLGIRLYKFLKYIYEYDSDIESNSLTKIFNRLKVFEDMNYIDKEEIIGKLGDLVRKINLNPDILYLNPSIDLYDLLIKYKNLEGKREQENLLDRKQLSKVVEILYKSGIRGISKDFNKGKIIYFKEDLGITYGYDDIDEFESLLNEFKYKELNNKLTYYLKNNNDIHGLEEEYLRKAYYLYKIGLYLNSYEILKSLSRYCLIEHSYVYFFIAQFNIKQLYALILNDSAIKENDGKYREKILEEIKEININEIYNNLPYKYREKVEFINQLVSFNYFYKLSYKLQKNIKQLKKQKETIASGGLSFNNDLYETYDKIINLINYIDKNYIIVSHFSEVKNLFSLFIEGIIINYSIKSDDPISNSAKRIKEIDLFILQIILKYVNYKDLKDYININNVKRLNICSDETRCLVDILENILYSYEENRSRHTIDFNQVINNILYLLSLCDINREEFIRVAKLFNEFIKTNYLDGSNFNMFLDFIIISFNKNINGINCNIISDIIETYIICLSRKTLNGFAYQMLYRDRFFGNLVSICKSLDNNININCNLEIDYIINNIIKKTDNLNELSGEIWNEFYNFIFIIYDVLDERNKTKIEKVSNDIMNKIDKDINPYLYITFTFNSLIKNIIVFDKQSQIEYTKYIRDYIMNEPDERKQDEVMRYLIDLISNNKIKYEYVNHLLKYIKNKFSIFSFFMDKDAFDYKYFDLEWLKYMQKKEIDDLMNDENARYEIMKLSLNKIKDIECKNIDNKFLDKVVVAIEAGIRNKKKVFKKYKRRFIK